MQPPLAFVTFSIPEKSFYHFLKHYDLTEAIIVQILSHLKIWFQPELKKNDFKQIQVTS
jgi:hypothetical protein